jgi:hypothetical protein
MRGGMSGGSCGGVWAQHTSVRACRQNATLDACGERIETLRFTTRCPEFRNDSHQNCDLRIKKSFRSASGSGAERVIRHLQPVGGRSFSGKIQELFSVNPLFFIIKCDQIHQSTERILVY